MQSVAVTALFLLLVVAWLAPVLLPAAMALRRRLPVRGSVSFVAAVAFASYGLSGVVALIVASSEAWLAERARDSGHASSLLAEAAAHIWVLFYAAMLLLPVVVAHVYAKFVLRQATAGGG